MALAANAFALREAGELPALVGITVADDACAVVGVKHVSRLLADDGEIDGGRWGLAAVVELEIYAAWVEGMPESR